MQLKVFILPVKNVSAAEAEMNAFLRSHRVLAVKKEFVPDGENSFWSFCVEYLESPVAGNGGGGGRPPRVDYKELLKPEEFEVFSRLREWRKGVAEKEGVPVYVVFSNERVLARLRARGGRQECRRSRGRIPWLPGSGIPVKLPGMSFPWVFRRGAVLALSFLMLASGGSVVLAEPVVSNVRAAQRAGTQLVDIYYDLAGGSATVSVAVSTNAGASYTLPATSFTGAVGNGVAPGGNKQIVWNAGQDWPGKFSSNVRFRVTASGQPPVPSGMALVPAGAFEMGDSFNDSSDFEGARPVHMVYVSAFYMDKYEVTKALWEDVRAWAVNNGYTDLGAGYGKAANHPVSGVNWYDVVKWCNARSEKDGRTPAYYTSAAQTAVYRTGQVDVQNDWVKWNTGYRLPTEAEWEKAARGGNSGQRFPWGNTITHGQANYSSSSSYSYDVSPTRGYHPTFNDGVFPYTSPVGYFEPNGYGLYDMAGNVWELCWDWWDGSYYSSSPASDPRGPVSGSDARVLRGGSWHSYSPDEGDGSAIFCRSASRLSYPPEGAFSLSGFRGVLPPDQ